MSMIDTLPYLILLVLHELQGSPVRLIHNLLHLLVHNLSSGVTELRPTQDDIEISIDRLVILDSQFIA